MSHNIENAIRSAARKIAAERRIPVHLIEEDLVESIMPHVQKLACPHVVQPNKNDETLYCGLAEGVAQRLRHLEQALLGAEKVALHVVAPSMATHGRWLAVHKDPFGQWQTSEHGTFSALILNIPTE